MILKGFVQYHFWLKILRMIRKKHHNAKHTCLFILILFFGIGSCPAIELSPEQAQSIGHKIWQNEGLGKLENLTVWNKAEDFPSFGIGHFIWYPAGEKGPFRESFPDLIRHLAQTRPIPTWLKNAGAAPWSSREDFYQNFNGPELMELRQLLQDCIGEQTAFIIQRMERALPQMLNSLAPDRRQVITQRFHLVAQQPNGPYALIDYVNFKGEGTTASERYQGEGWGLLQVLHNMDDRDSNVMQAFVTSADFVLTRRVANAPRDEQRWLAGWRKRLQTYLP